MGMESTLLAHAGATKVTRQELLHLPTPPETDTFKPIPHAYLVNELESTLALRHISIIHDEYAVSPDGMKLFGLLELDAEYDGVRFAIGLRNANDKSMRLGMTAGYRVFVCDNMAFSGDFTPVFHKHTKGLELTDVISIAVDKIQRNFAPMQSRIEAWKGLTLSEGEAKVIIYDAFRAKDLKLPIRLMASVHRYYFRPAHVEFAEPTLWSLSNAFTSAFKELKPVQKFQATARLSAFLEQCGEQAVIPDSEPAAPLALLA